MGSMSLIAAVLIGLFSFFLGPLLTSGETNVIVFVVIDQKTVGWVIHHAETAGPGSAGQFKMADNELGPLVIKKAT